jgi:hypothetical protein
MKLNEKDAVKYALGCIQTTLYPKQYTYEEILNRGKIEEKEFTNDTLLTLTNIQSKIKSEMSQEKDQEYAYLYFLSRDVGKVIRFLSKTSIDFGNIKERLRIFAEETVTPELRKKLGIRFVSPPINFVKELPGRQWPERRGGGFGADQWQANRYGIPEGVYIHEASLAPDSEVILIHEIAHTAIEAFPNFVEWFDEGLCDLMAYWIYAEYTGHLKFRKKMKYAEEFADYFTNPERLFRRPDNMFCSLLLIGGLELIKLLMQYKREEPSKVRWHLIPSLLQEGVDLPTFLKKAIKEPVDLPEPDIPPLLRRITATVLAHNISHVLSPLALLLFMKILSREPYPCRWKIKELVNEHITRKGAEEAISELRKRSLIWVFPEQEIEPYMGPFIGVNHFIEAGLIRAWARRYEPKQWGD